MEEVSGLAPKDQLDSDGEKKRKMEDFLGMRKRRNEAMHNVFKLYS